MENLLILLAAAVGALLLGILFIKRYDRIDRHFFGRIRRTVPDMNTGRLTLRTVASDDPDYKPFGRFQVLASAVCGAAICIIMVMTSNFFGLGANYSAGKSLSLAAALVWVVILSYNLYEAIARMETFGTRIGKFVFLTAACVIGFGAGVVGSLLIFAAIVFYIIFLAMKFAVSGRSLKPGEIELDDGTVVRNRKGLFGEDNWEEKDGKNVFDRTGDTFVKRN